MPFGSGIGMMKNKPFLQIYIVLLLILLPGVLESGIKLGNNDQ